MQYAVLSAVCPAELEEPVAEAMGALGFTTFVWASRNDGQADLTLYAVGGALAPEVEGSLVALGVVPLLDRVASGEDLVKGYLPDEPSELCPGVWVDPHGRLPAGQASMVLRLPPSLAFGDGHHPTTRLAARLLMQLEVSGRPVLDVGCGTGVLAVLAAKRGAARVVASDIDPAAVEATATAAALNGCVVEVRETGLLDGLTGVYTVLCANLYAELLLELFAHPEFDARFPAGDLVLSGIHVAKRPQVEAALAGIGARVVAVVEEAWWCGLRAERPAIRRPG